VIHEEKQPISAGNAGARQSVRAIDSAALPKKNRARLKRRAAQRSSH